MILPSIIFLLCSSANVAIVRKDGKECAAEFQDAIEVNIRPECRELLAPIVAAIRYAENGRAGREYGILHPRVKPTYRSQAGWCAATVQKNYDRWNKVGDFIEFLGARYCPVGADNDPTGLNRHWVGNVTKLTKKIRSSGTVGDLTYSARSGYPLPSRFPNRGQTMDNELAYRLILYVESETKKLSDEEYIRVLEEVSCALDASVDAKRCEMDRD